MFYYTNPPSVPAFCFPTLSYVLFFPVFPMLRFSGFSYVPVFRCSVLASSASECSLSVSFPLSVSFFPFPASSIAPKCHLGIGSLSRLLFLFRPRRSFGEAFSWFFSKNSHIPCIYQKFVVPLHIIFRSISAWFPRYSRVILAWL